MDVVIAVDASTTGAKALAFAADGAPRHRPRSIRDDALAAARTCYDHLAGRLGVALADALTARGHLILSDDGGTLTPMVERLGEAYIREEALRYPMQRLGTAQEIAAAVIFLASQQASFMTGQILGVNGGGVMSG